MNINRDDLLALALGLLGPEDEARVQAALQADPALLAEYRADLEALHQLPESLPAAEVPAGAQERLLARVRAESAAKSTQVERPGQAERTGAEAAGARAADSTPASHSIPLFPGTPAPSQPAVAVPETPGARPRHPNWRWGLLGLVAAVGLGLLWLRPAEPADSLSAFARTPGAVTQALAADGVALGQLIRLPDGRAYLHLNAAAPRDRVYQLWRLENGQPVPAGVFDGQGIVLARAPAGQTVAVSVEPPGGSAQPTTKPLLVQEL